MSTAAKITTDPWGQHPELYYQNLTATHSRRQHMILPPARSVQLYGLRRSGVFGLCCSLAQLVLILLGGKKKKGG